MNKIQALKTTIEKLESGEYKYQWTDDESCNCGLIVKTILHGKKIRDAGWSEIDFPHINLPVWSRKAQCMETGLPLVEVFQKLKDTGFSRIDILELENLSNEIICKKLGWERLFIHDNYFVSVSGAELMRGQKENLIAYLKEWVKILEFKGTPPEPPVKIKYVSVPETILESNEIVLS